MPRPIDFMDMGADSAAFNMGLDEAILEETSAGSSAGCLRFYAWEPRAVSIGYFQGAREECDPEACVAEGVDLVRRCTGGGAVFHDQELTYSIVLPLSDPLAAGSVLDSYRRLCAGLVEGLARLGLKAEFAPLNDILIDARKVSGNAQTRRSGCLLQHGTLLLGLDREAMFRFLRVPREKAAGRDGGRPAARVASISEMLGRTLGYTEAALACAAGFSGALDLELRRREPGPGLLARAEEIAARRYADPAWTFRR
jgi:lipoate-protein ligase A